MNATATLTKRENEIAELIAWGSTKKDVANRLFVSERTVENHARSIYDKIECNKVNELSAWWFCRTFNISFDLSPIKKQIIALAFLAIIIPSELFANQNIIRMNRSGRMVECRAGRRSGRRSSEEDALFNY